MKKRLEPIAPANPDTHHSPPWRRILFWLLASRFVIAMLAGFSSLIIPPGPSMGAPANLWDAFMRWDTGWFISVLERGYFIDSQGSNIPFMPLFPALVWICSLGKTIPPMPVGVLLSNAALFYGCLRLWRITRRRWDSIDTADLAVILVLFSPVNFFLSIFYSEGVFFCAVAACLDDAEQDRWLTAGLWGMAAALARNSGFFLFIPLIIYFFFPWNKLRPWRQLPYLAFPILGAGLFTLYLWYNFHDPFIFAKVQQNWGRELASPWHAFESGFHNNWLPWFYRYLFHGAAIFSILMAALAVFLRARPAWIALMVVWPVLYFSTTRLDSTPRYLTTVVPYYSVAAAAVTLRWPAARYPLLLWSAMLLMLCALLFVNGYWFV